MPSEETPETFALSDVALLIRCPNCGATAESAFLNQWSTASVPTHPERLARAKHSLLVARERVQDAH